MADEAHSGHEQFSEDLALYALGVLDPAAGATLKEHMEGCAACRRELAELRGDAALFALSAGGAVPPQRSRERLLSAIAKEPAVANTRIGRSWWSWVTIFAAAILLVVAAIGWRNYLRVKNDNESLVAKLNQAEKQAAEARGFLDMLRAHDAKSFTLVSAAVPHREPIIHTIYQPRTGHMLMMAHNLAPLPAKKVYQLWLVPMKGEPMSAGVFWPDATGSAIMEPSTQQMPAGTQAKAFAVTIENEGGAATPTLPIILQGTGQE
jgi:anti-sigma-K factor RskA